MHKSILSFISVFIVLFSKAQWHESNLNYGLKAGVTYSKITGLETTILSEPYFINYTLNTKPRVGGAGGFFLNYRINDALALESELMYAEQGSDLEFNNVEKDFNYKMEFKYQFVNLLGQIKLYPFNLMDAAKNNPHGFKYGFYLGAGPQLGLNVASNNIVYTSGGAGRLDAFGSDLEQQQQLRNVLKGKTNFGASFGLGYEIDDFGLAIDARYFLGLTDVVETQANAYNFIENKNINKTFQFTIAWDFSVFNQRQN